MPKSVWTEEQERELIRLYREGYSAGAAADLLGMEAGAVSNKIQKLVASGRMERREKTTTRKKRIDHGPKKAKPPEDNKPAAPIVQAAVDNAQKLHDGTDRTMLVAARLIKSLGASGFSLIEMKFTNIEDTELIVGVNSYEH